MKSISITKPDMATVGQNPNGLSCFGLLSELFLKELSARTQTSTDMMGAYRPLSLFYLPEEEAEEAPSAPPQISLNFDLKVVLDAIRRQNEEDAKRREKKKDDKPSAPEKAPGEKKDGKPSASEKKPVQPIERIIERILIKERELKVSTENTQRIILQTPRRRWEIGPMSLRPTRLKGTAPSVRDGASGASANRPILPAILARYAERSAGASSPTFARDIERSASANRPTLPATLAQYAERGASSPTLARDIERSASANRPTLPATLAQYAERSAGASSPMFARDIERGTSANRSILPPTPALYAERSAGASSPMFARDIER
ncbi:MAG: hypothetical protein IKN96_09180, partial [Oscillibacter sp.]|nr:hypothetical protein [Oscillibacter sp.]